MGLSRQDGGTDPSTGNGAGGLSTATVTRRPTRLSSAVAVVAATVAVALGVGGQAAGTPLAVELAGLAVAAGGSAISARGYRAVGLPIVVGGAAVSLAALPIALATAGGPSVVVALVPGLVGVFVLAMALLPARGHGSRSLVRLGAGLVFLGVLAAALFRLTPTTRLLAAALLSVVAWDAGDNAIGLGVQLGRAATTTRPALVHLGGTVVVGVAGVATANVIREASLGTASLESFVLLVGALVLLTASLHG